MQLILSSILLLSADDMTPKMLSLTKRLALLIHYYYGHTNTCPIISSPDSELNCTPATE